MEKALRVLAPVALLAALALAGCSAPAADDQPDGSASASAPTESAAPAEEAAPSEPLGQETLEEHVAAAGLQLIDIEAQGGVDALAGALEGVTVEPAECQALMESGFALVQENESTFAVGMDEQTGVTGGIMSFADPAIVGTALDANTAAGGACSDITVTTATGDAFEGHIEVVDVEVAGADQAYGTVTTTTVQGTEVTNATVTAAVGTAYVTGSSAFGDDVVTAATETAQKLVDQLTAE
ncbi:hypothetical protein [Microbacterium sp.]|uniref:hypothetical protein n=1 Tax=Microbacterium sp. TaxID=51671 RepID=UPI002811A5C5|nr:hypothetical protein [Microbacterium sp.]